MAKKGQYIYEYPHPAVTADSIVFGYDGKELKVLLIKRGAEKEASTTAFVGEWALPGGFLDVEKDKTIAHTAARELKEETGLKLQVKDFKEVGTFSEMKRDPRERVITIAHYALVKLTEVQASTDADKAEWYSWDDIPHPSTSSRSDSTSCRRPSPSPSCRTSTSPSSRSNSTDATSPTR